MLVGVFIKSVFGKTLGLKASQVKGLERLFRKSVGGRIVSPDCAKDMAQQAAELGRIVGILVDRRGAVQDVMLGDASRLYLPDIGRSRARRLRGLRLIAAKPAKNKNPIQDKVYSLDFDFAVDLEKLRLDAIVQFEALEDGQPGKVVLGYVAPGTTDADGRFVGHAEDRYRDVYALDLDFSKFISDVEQNVEAQLEKINAQSRSNNSREICVIVGAYTSPKTVWESSLSELRELAQTAQVTVVEEVVQRRAELDPKTVVGKGKLEEICLRALNRGAEALIFDCDLSPSQLNAITDLTDLKVIDRTMLILDIFARRATSKGGKMQVELAQLMYSLPRLSKKQEGLSRLTGGIGGVGPGETKLEVDRRRVKERIARFEKELEGLRQERKLRRKMRGARDVPTVAIVGYTNAGKSTLFNALTNAEVYAADQLFATLDPTSRRIKFPKDRELILTDTVGFIRNLPEGLVNAFKATLEELHDADLLLHVVDVTDKDYKRHIKVVDDLLDDLEIVNPKRILVLNKIDKADSELLEARIHELSACCVSALTRQGLPDLISQIDYAIWHKGKGEVSAGVEEIVFDARKEKI